MTGGKPVLRKAYRAVIDAAREEAEKFGGEIEYDLAGGKHPRVFLRLAGQTRLIPFASTPRVADQAPANMRQRIRKKVKEIMA